MSLPQPKIPEDNAAVQHTYDRYCRFGETANAETVTGMTSRNFVKLFKDCELVDKKVTLTVLDLAFTKAKTAKVGPFVAESKRINYLQFLVAVELCAKEKGVDSSHYHAKLAAHADQGPKVTATEAGYNKFYDDKDTWTARDRGSHKPLSRGDSLLNLPTPKQPADPEALFGVFDRYSRFGETANVETVTGMTSRNFIKLFRDCELEDKKLNATFLDLAFTKAKTAPVGRDLSDVHSKRINFEQFLIALEICAGEQGVDPASIHDDLIMRSAEGPKVRATEAGYNKFYDDKDTWTARDRGTFKPLSKGDSSSSLPVPTIPEDFARVQAAFDRYCKFGETANAHTAVDMTSRNFVKLLKDAGLEDRKLTATFMDLAFTKARTAKVGVHVDIHSKRINFDQFLIAVELCAQERGVSAGALHDSIASKATEGPKVQATEAGYNKFHDDKSTYTANLRGEHKPLSRSDSASHLPTAVQPADPAAMASVFDKYCKFGETANAQLVTGMTSRNFLKLFRDFGLEDKKLNATFLDLAFTKAKTAKVGKELSQDPASKRINLQQFLIALELCAEQKGVHSVDLHAALCSHSSDAPKVQATEAGYNRFHDGTRAGAQRGRGERAQSTPAARTAPPLAGDALDSSAPWQRAQHAAPCWPSSTHRVAVSQRVCLTP